MSEAHASRFVEVTRFVTARELSRSTGALLDAVTEGTRLVVTRAGLPIAVIEPSEELALLHRARSTAPVDVFEPSDPEPLDLTQFGIQEDEWVVLEAWSRLRNKDLVIRETKMSISAVSVAMVHLELNKLMQRTQLGYAVTDLGLRAVEAWKKSEGRD